MPWILSRIPLTWKTLLTIFFGQWEKANKVKLYSFSPQDIGFRGWYNKLANDFHSRGRFGYIWDNGLGMAASDLTYNNLATYTLLRVFGTRCFMAIGFISMLTVIATIIFIGIKTPIALFAIILIGASPLFVACFTRLGKPEFTICSISLAAIYLIINGKYLEAGLIWSIISFINLPESIMLIIYAGILGLIQSVVDKEFIILLTGMTPGIVKLTFRLAPMWISGAMQNLTEQQTKVWSNKSWRPKRNEIFFLTFFIISLLIVIIMNNNAYAAIALATGSIAFLANTRIIYYNDPLIILMYIWMIALATACFSDNISALFPLIVFLYPPLTYLSYTPLPQETNSPPMHKNERDLLALLQYPCLTPMPYIYPIQLIKFHNILPRYARFLTEFDGDPRTESNLRSFWCWGDHARESKTLNLANSMYLRIQEKELNDNVITRLRIPEMSGKQIDKTLKKLGASYIVAYSDITVIGLVDQKYKIRFICDLGQEKEFCALLGIEPRKLFLLEAPEERCVVGGATDLRIEGSTLTWTAKKSMTYQIRYRHLPGFSATLNGKPLKLTPYRPFAESPTTFMSVRTDDNGELRVHFKGHIFPSLPDIRRKLTSLGTKFSYTTGAKS